MKLKIHYHRSNSGRNVISDYINLLDKKIQYEIYSFLKRFENDFHFRQYPHCKKITKDVFEIRIKIKDSYRILYGFIYNGAVVFLHIFKKKTNKIPKKDLKLAINRLKSYEQ
ncbi:hypothetical protein COV49_02665 [Candidatus Falkowbacteria bacterium CG11_big_fil_rev_8_21_14_0_20_39_10]|uniref:Addiction module toxin RelE n=1 Tax=Candidatus Falkowbacteria bacterium CG11_big_fil_rev_8_21_14_0_20_39_10 TaxID=1974570 RepID=A0A2M6K8R2_9BACT|nr:MAG: hypothetical protein COV49_02665 [Candidatus Falkowbacteria bacterium CG11_big_fil_rev_8_21_14_0_20_39_10]